MIDGVVSSEDAVSVIRDGDTVCVSGFVGVGTPDELLIALEKRFLETGHPRNLTLVFAAAPGDGDTKGLNRLAHPGLVKRGIGGHWSLVPKLAKMAVEGEIEAYNLPLGCISQLYREIAGGKPGMLSKVGLRTFVDPRLQGGKVNDITTDDLVSVEEVDGQEWLYYRTLPIDVALLRATTGDTHGNCTMEREALKLDATAMAMATHNSDGVVIVQVERMAIHGSLLPKRVMIPGALVDCMVKSQPENHLQTYATPYNHAYSGELRQPLADVDPMDLTERKIIARRAAFELPLGGVVNLGIGMPEGVANVAAEEGLLGSVTLTAEPGVIGGMPQGGLNFGAALNPDAIVAQNVQFDFYDGGGLDMACLGMAQTDRYGNVNVSKFGPRFAGAGGFINISQNASRLVLAGTFTAGGLKVAIEDGQLRILQEGKLQKFIPDVEQITFSGQYAAETNQPVLYVTERCVFSPTRKGLELIEVAPGIDIEQDILPNMGFEPVINSPRAMDARIFRDEPMGLADAFFAAPLKDRIRFEPSTNKLEVNFRGYRMTEADDLTELEAIIEQYCKGLEGQVDCVVHYDGFTLNPALEEAHKDTIARLEKRFYRSARRITSNPFQRLRFGLELAKRDVSTRIRSGEVVTGTE
ncbi:acyl CoA:acetate/3-ketoacid CoA transferase [Ruegeria lacuscaerulensis]|uniref:acyl CoA:acetate/3-ketoacid CoA transferase n=1 Tax=Ruegeria lacuscaerulensis TaxID=55218 RepID=UPI00147E1E60|nr:acyl CoA:acetate/3-ketoacid CoA transferase [Ruegeria lacuscaerulensis]